MTVQIYVNRRASSVYGGQALQRIVLEMLGRAGIGPSWVVGVELAEATKMRWLNYTYRRRNRSTDILSFPLTSTEEQMDSAGRPSLDQPHLPYEPSFGKSPLLGEIFISPEVVARRLRHPPVSRLRHRIRRLLAHGIGHLLGYDHQTISEYRRMYRIECRLLGRRSIKNE